ncbi:MAG: hypothetical protein GXP53_05940 [Deltaproteobacteria bacterium]|nr:hypothetical protein [Deltaproteobacteria bacterium]
MIPVLFKHHLIMYLRKSQTLFIEALVLVLCTAIFCITAFYVFDMLWQIYLETQVGQRFIITCPKETAAIRDLLDINFCYFAVELTITSFLICLSIAAFCRFLHISSHFYLSMGIPAKLLFWWLPLSGVVGFYIQREYGFVSMDIVLFVASIPTLFMFMGCFKYANKLIPEAGPLLAAGANLAKKTIKEVVNRLSEEDRKKEQR